MEKGYEKALKAFQNKEYKKAYPILLRLAELGHAEAQCLLGNVFELGLGRQRDREMAKEWYLKSSNQGYAVASNNLGTLFLQEGNQKKSKYWYKIARRQGFVHGPLRKDDSKNG